MRKEATMAKNVKLKQTGYFITFKEMDKILHAVNKYSTKKVFIINLLLKGGNNG